MKTLLLAFGLGNALLWCLLYGLAYLLWPQTWEPALQCSLTAWLLCLIPSTLTLLWSCWSVRQSGDQQFAAMLGGTGVRLFFVLGVGLTLASTVPYLQEQQYSFWYWVLTFYLATLALEMVLLVCLQNRGESPQRPGAAQE